jgi:hypothetical protein
VNNRASNPKLTLRLWLWCACLSLLTTLVYVLALLSFRISLYSDIVLLLLEDTIMQASGAVMMVVSTWLLSRIYIDLYLLFLRIMRKNGAALELSIHSNDNAGGEDALVSRRQKWSFVYPFSMLLLAVGWYAIVYPPIKLH